MKKGNCINCYYFIVTNSGTEDGECHRYPPVPVVKIMNDEYFELGTSQDGNNLWFSFVTTQTSMKQWCGEWKLVETI